MTIRHPVNPVPGPGKSVGPRPLVTAAAPAQVSHEPRTGWSRVRAIYFGLVVALTLSVAVASFIRDRGQLLSNISLWLFLAPFAASLWRPQFGFLVAMFLLTVTPSLHEQLNVLAGTALHAWVYPGVDCCLGFLAAWVVRGGLRGIDNVLDRFPGGPLLLFHVWVALSAVLAVGRNLWQSASELSLRGLAYNVWLTRGIIWHDDYYPIQDRFFYSVALAMLFGAWVFLSRSGERLLKGLVGVVLAGAIANVVFALWQKATGMGWVNGQWSINANALWPDLHSFGAYMAAALGLGFGLLVIRGTNLAGWLSVFAAGLGLYLSGSRSTLFLVFAVLIVWALVVSLKLRGWRRAIPMLAAIAVALTVHWTLDHGYRGISYAVLNQQLHEEDLKSLNVALSNRPEIWAAALRMYFEFPLFGLGQGVRLPAECAARVFGQRIFSAHARRRCTQRIPAHTGRARSDRFGLGVVNCNPVCQAGTAKLPLDLILCADRHCARQCLHECAASARTSVVVRCICGQLFLGGSIEWLRAVAAAVASDNALRFNRPADACAGSICRSSTEPQQVPVHLRAALFRSSTADRGRLDARRTAYSRFP